MSYNTVTFSKSRSSILPTSGWKQFFLHNQQAPFAKNQSCCEKPQKKKGRNAPIHVVTKAATNEISMDATSELDSFFTISEEHLQQNCTEGFFLVDKLL